MWIQALSLMQPPLGSPRGAVFGKLLGNVEKGGSWTIVGELSLRRKSGARRGMRDTVGETRPEARVPYPLTQGTLTGREGPVIRPQG